MRRAARISIGAALVSLAALIVIGALLIRAYIEQDRRRDLLEWESRLALVVGARAEAVNRMLAQSRREVEELAANASLRFYVWQLARARPGAEPPVAAEPGALGYLRNLLLAAADRYGYTDPASRIPANVPQPRTAGLAVLDDRLELVVATPGLREVAATHGDFARRVLASAGRGARSELARDAQGRPVLVTAAPIGTVPGAAGEAPIGLVLGIRSAEQDLFPLLRRGPSFSEESEALLLARREDGIVLLSPTRDGTPGLQRTLEAGRTDLAEAAAVAAPGQFVVLPNYRGARVLQVSRPIHDQDWVLVQQVDAEQAFSLAEDRRRFLVATLTLLLFFFAAMAVAAWRHGSSVRARHQAAELADKAARLQRQTDLLHTIADNLDVLTLLVARDERVRFCNRAAAEAAGSSIDAILDSALGSFLPEPVLHEVREGIAAARGAEPGPVHRMLQWPAGDSSRTYRASFIPVERVGEETEPTLVVLTDLTELERAQRRHTELLRRLVLTLVSAVDRHDPWAANHAQRMTDVADALARELGFSERERSSIDLAASLANIGKIMVPVEVLTKTEPLTAEEQQLLRKHVEYGLELLRGLEFDGPVTQMIAEKQERPDGRGYPHGITGDRLSLGGQVLAVANAFVALTSPRAWRPGLSVREALDELMRVAGSQFDRRVIAALFHVAENRRDWLRLE